MAEVGCPGLARPVDVLTVGERRPRVTQGIRASHLEAFTSVQLGAHPMQELANHRIFTHFGRPAQEPQDT